MATTHTPGPWVAGGISIDGPDGLLAETGFGMRKDEETRANARLISAAPDYWEATEAIRKHLVEGEIAGVPDVERIPTGLLKALLAAHVKADHELTVMREAMDAAKAVAP